jgi:hypothetical protein
MELRRSLLEEGGGRKRPSLDIPFVLKIFSDKYAEKSITLRIFDYFYNLFVTYTVLKGYITYSNKIKQLFRFYAESDFILHLTVLCLVVLLTAQWNLWNLSGDEMDHSCNWNRSFLTV